MRRIVVGVLVLIAFASVSLSAAEIKVLATIAAQSALHSLEKEYQRPDYSVKIDFDTSPNITKRLASGDVHDVLLASSATIDELVREDRAIASSRVSFGKVGIGVAKSPAARAPDLSSPDALKASVLRAGRVLYSQGASGLLVEKLFRDLGIADQIQTKAEQLPNGTEVMLRLGANRGDEIGFTMISEIKGGESFGGSLVGPLPSTIQTYTQYDVVVMSRSVAPGAAGTFISAISSPSARRVLSAAGWES
jgi:molybdate transport system substrate-binding protein